MKNGYQFSLQVIEKGARLGYPPENLPLLFLVPFVQVAWAEGFVQAVEQKAILSFAHNVGVKPGHPAFEQLLVWFDERPSEEFFASAMEDLRELIDALPSKQAERLRSMLLFGCLEVAHASGEIGLLRGRSNIRREEREVLRNIGGQIGLTASYV